MNGREGVGALLERTDRIALAVGELEPAIDSYRRLFDAAIAGDEKDRDAVARRVTLQWGEDFVELYEPAGDGPVADFLKAGRRALFAGSFSLEPTSVVAGARARAFEGAATL